MKGGSDQINRAELRYPQITQITQIDYGIGEREFAGKMKQPAKGKQVRLSIARVMG